MKKDVLRILMCASEAIPFVKTGGLADVVGSLPKALKKQGCDVKIFLPLYRAIKQTKFKLELCSDKIFIPVGVHHFTGYIWKSKTEEGIEVFFLEKDEFFDRSYLYGNPDPQRGDYEDNAERFILFCRAVFSLCMHIKWIPDIFHIHDWQAALVSPYLVYHWRTVERFGPVKSLLTIHNLAFQGIFPGIFFDLTHLPYHFFNMEGMEYWGQCNFLKAGIVCSDYISTVSPTYAKQIQTPEHGYGLDGVLRNRADHLTGILNGIDAQTWDPSNDPFIPAPYDAENLAGKRVCKKKLLRELGLMPDLIDRPLCAIIGRMTHQKGYDLIYSIAPKIFDSGGALVVLGTGNPDIEALFRKLNTQYSGQCAAIFDFDEALAHRIEAGADIFLMPSRFEPCGLNQMYSLRYGTVPVVFATGGLEDSVIDVKAAPEKGTGFKFYNYSDKDFWEALEKAFKLFETEKWVDIQKRGMKQDFSWDSSARKYVNLYETILSS